MVKAIDCTVVMRRVVEDVARNKYDPRNLENSNLQRMEGAQISAKDEVRAFMEGRPLRFIGPESSSLG